MKAFMDKDFLLETETAKHLFHDYAEKLPLVDYHCHLNPREIYEDRRFDNLTEVWLGTLPGKTLISEADDALAELHAGVEEIHRDETALYVSVLLLKEDSDATARALAGKGFLRLTFKGLPAEGDVPAKEQHKLCLRKLDELDNQLQICADRLRALSERLPDVKGLFDLEMTALTAASSTEGIGASGAGITSKRLREFTK